MTLDAGWSLLLWGGSLVILGLTLGMSVPVTPIPRRLPVEDEAA